MAPVHTKTIEEALFAKMADRADMTREAWLNEVTARMAPWFADLGYPLPGKIRCSVGWPFGGGRSNVIGECWEASASGDDTNEIFVSPRLDDPVMVAATLAHELVHAAVGIEAKHGPLFKKVAKGIGLGGKMTATVPEEHFRGRIEPILAAVGPLPHAALTGKSSAKPKQTTRMIKCVCPECGYVARTTRKWIDDTGTPHCPAHGAMEIEADEAD